jgi:hypothetical protein
MQHPGHLGRRFTTRPLHRHRQGDRDALRRKKQVAVRFLAKLGVKFPGKLVVRVGDGSLGRAGRRDRGLICNAPAHLPASLAPLRECRWYNGPDCHKCRK